jgi:ATP-dependent Clp protease adaptor protein ClpS
VRLKAGRVVSISLGFAVRTAVDEGGFAMPEAIDVEPGSGSTPAAWSVMLLNDDHTPMDFVVYALEELFEMEHDEAVRLMLRVHEEGAGECGVFAEKAAKMKVDEVLALAREHQHPLQCVMERKRST